jgi:hypothetical protein
VVDVVGIDRPTNLTVTNDRSLTLR